MSGAIRLSYIDYHTSHKIIGNIPASEEDMTIYNLWYYQPEKSRRLDLRH